MGFISCPSLSMDNGVGGERPGDLPYLTFRQENSMGKSSNVLDMMSCGRTPRLRGINQATGEEQGSFVSNSGIYDVAGGNPMGTSVVDVARDESLGLRFNRPFLMATWNVRGMNQGKLDIVKSEMKRLDIDLLGVAELHWTDSGHFRSDEFDVYFSGHDINRKNGVAFITHKHSARAVESFSVVNDRIMTIRLNGRPSSITVLQVYAPTTDATEEEVERFYVNLEDTLDNVPKKDIVYIMGDFNAKIGGNKEEGIVGGFGLGVRNDAGDRLVQFCQEKQFWIANTWFMQPKRRLYTWTSPNGLYRNQIDFILCGRRWSSSVMLSKTYPGADCGTDHELLVAKIKVKLCSVKKSVPVRKFDVEKIPPAYAVEVGNRFDLLDTSDKMPEELWQIFRDGICEAATNHIPFKKKEKRKKWLSERTVGIAEQRRLAKVRGERDEVGRLNAEFQRAARRDKESYWNDQCKQMEEEYRRGYTRDAFAQLKRVRAPFTCRKGGIKDHSGKDLNDRQDIKDRWREYTEQLYSGKSGSGSSCEDLVEDEEMEPDILVSEVEWALKQIPNGKAAGIDNIQVELLRYIPLTSITALCQRVWETGVWPLEWKRSVFIPLPKKGDSRECSNYRTIALIPHMSKVLLKIIQQRMSQTMERELPDAQAGFRRGRGTRDHIANLRWIMERSREYKKDVYMCFVDYKKAFDCVEHNKLWSALHGFGVSSRVVGLLRALYTDQEATVRTVFGDTDWFKVGRGVRQGCILSPCLFNLYAEAVMRGLRLEESDIGVRIGGRVVNSLRYADDTTLISETEEGLKILIMRVKEESEKFGLLFNVKKTRIMTTAGDGTVKIDIDNERIKCVKDYVFLGAKMVREGECGPEIRRRIVLGRSAMMSLNKIWMSRDVGIGTKCRLVRAFVFPVVTYGCESWTVKKVDRRRIDAFELWCWRRMLRIPWTAKVRNTEVLGRVKPELSLEGTVTKNRLTYFGHVMRSESMEKDIMLGLVGGTRRPGRQRTRWLDIIKDDTGLDLGQLRMATEDRMSWRMRAHGIAKSRIRLNG